MTIAAGSIENRLGIAFSATTKPTTTQVTALVASMRLSFEANYGSAAVDATDKVDEEMLLLMCIIGLADSYRSMNGFATSAQTENGVYTFSDTFVNRIKADLERLENIQYPEVTPEASFEYLE
jgi:hypothetical protein